MLSINLGRNNHMPALALGIRFPREHGRLSVVIASLLTSKGIEGNRGECGDDRLQDARTSMCT